MDEPAYMARSVFVLCIVMGELIEKMVTATWSLVGQHYKVTMSAHSQVGTGPDITFDVART